MVYRTTAKMAKRKESHRAKLLETALRQFGKQGYHATTVPRIVRESGSSTGAFYFYFRNKEDVFARVLEFIGEQIAAALNQAIGAAGQEPIAQMKAAMNGFIRYLVEHPQESRILIVESSGLGGKLEGARRVIIASHTRSVERALAGMSRALPALDPKIAASCWVGAVHEAVRQWLEAPAETRITAEKLAKEICGFNLRAIGMPAANP
ncbi:MAG TPA: TetR/AcrR family transcriptional regulator [Candidatus Eremiobacteraceae bacterium]|nr:TetR/AcrR family transcriptional regulator [Candidatus Eremiobacteraceae bacterium]